MRALKFKFRRFYFFNNNSVFFEQDLTKLNINLFKKDHTHKTQEFSCRYLDELLIFIKEIHFYRNNDNRQLAYSYSQKPCIMVDLLALLSYPQVRSMFRRIESGAKSERFQPLWIE